MRLLLACLALGACATAEIGAPDRIVRGCWIDRAETATTMRWLPDRGGRERLVGEKLAYGEGDPVGALYTLERRGPGRVFCDLPAPDAPAGACWPVSGAPEGELEPGRVVIQGDAELLHITRLSGGDVTDIYFGRRDGCD